MRFCLLLGALMAFGANVVGKKQSRDLFSGFLEEPDAYDVLF